MFFISNKYGRIDPLMKEYILQTTNESIKKKLEHLNKNKYGKLLNFVTPSNNNEIYSITKNNTFKIINSSCIFGIYLFGVYLYFI